MADARQQVPDIRGKVSNGINPQREPETSPQANLTLKAFVTDDYHHHAYATKRGAKDDESRMRNILPDLGHLPIAEINSQL